MPKWWNLVDTHGSEPCDRKVVGVQISPSAPFDSVLLRKTSLMAFGQLIKLFIISSRMSRASIASREARVLRKSLNN